MTPEQVVNDAKKGFKQAQEHFMEELKKVRTGRAHPSMLDNITVEAYGQPMPLIQVGGVSAPEPQLLQITPYDPNNLEAISKAIREDQGLGMNPMDDGKVVRIPVPPLTEERRREYVKIVGGKTEDAMISLRNARHDAMDTINKAKKDGDVSEDDAKRLSDQVDQAMNEVKKEIEETAKVKESEIMTV
ncbi:MAG: ribosome recycling factor [Candidatus Saccharibacteria bacterium]|nr:ribosome recycling factor [Candidatus Saccharibacteria bacterium]